MMQALERPEVEDSNHLASNRDGIADEFDTRAGSAFAALRLDSIGDSLQDDIASLAVKESINEDHLMQQLQAAKDENELLEFKNYELLFKIQELEQAQSRCNPNKSSAGFHKSSSSLCAEVSS